MCWKRLVGVCANVCENGITRQERARGRKRREVRVEACFAELLSWSITNWQGEHRLALALDATTLGERFMVLSVSVVYRGCAIPVAWHILRAKEEGEWRGPIEALFAALQGVIPADWQVIVMADRGLYAPWLYQSIQRLGWHPVLRVKEGMSFRAEEEEQAPPIGERVKHHGRRWCGRGVWSEQGTPMEGTLVVKWEESKRRKNRPAEEKSRKPNAKWVGQPGSFTVREAAS